MKIVVGDTVFNLSEDYRNSILNFRSKKETELQNNIVKFFTLTLKDSR